VTSLIAITNTIHLTGQTRFIGGMLALIFFVFLVEMVRRHRLEERYTIVWFLAGLALVVMVAVPDTIYWLASAMGVRDTNVALFAVALLACLGLLLNLTIVVSRLAEQSTRLAQELALERANRQAESDAGQAEVGSTAGAALPNEGPAPTEQP
jgi:hypothetical protein